MGMFDSYDNLNPDYIPDNIHTATPQYVVLDTSMPRPVYNIKGELLGYEWTWGENFGYGITNQFTITVFSNSIIYSNPGEAPINETEGVEGQQAYNTSECISWTCVGLDNGSYKWVQDDFITYPINGDKVLTFTPNMDGKKLQATIYNFRGEQVYEATEDNVYAMVIPVNDDLNKIMLPGTYSLRLAIIDNEEIRIEKTITIFVR